MNKHKVLLLGKLPPPYMGPAVATQILLNSKLKELYELHHVNTKAHDSLTTFGKWSFNKILRNLGVYVSLARSLYQKEPDLVLIPIDQETVGFLKDSVFVLLSRLFRRRTLLQLRGSNFKNWLGSASKPVRAYVELILLTTQGVIVLGNNLRHLFADYYPENRIFVVPNGANYQIAPLAKSSPDGNVHILYLANLQASKGIEDIIRGVALLKEQRMNSFTLDVVGAWRDAITQETCLQLVKEHDLPVTFYGPAFGAEKFKFLAEADIFVFAPREPEGHPWVVVEALAAGLPIISTDQGAIIESVQNNVNGFIVDRCSPEQIADRMKQLIEQPELRAAQGKASRQHYLENFTEEKTVERLSVVFNELLQARQPIS